MASKIQPNSAWIAISYLIACPRESPQPSQLAAETGVTIRRIAAREFSPNPKACLAALHPMRERLLVMTRVPLEEEMVSAIAAARQVPVLVIEPERLSTT